MTNCPNCGAPFTGTVCQYCGTRFEDIFRIPEGAPVKLSWETNGKRITVNFLMESMDVHYYSNDTTVLYADGNRQYYIPATPSLRMSFEGVCVPFEWKVGDETKTVYTIQEDVAR